MSSAEIGYIFNNCKTNIKQSISLLFFLANKVYIQINDNKKNIEVINLYPKPKEDKNIYENIPKRCIEVMKLKDVDTSLNNSEKLIMEYFFKESRNKKITANFNKFDEVKEGLISKGFIKIISDNIEEINKEKDKFSDVIDTYEKELSEYNNNIKKLPELSNYEKELYDNLFKHENNVVLNNCRDVYNAVHSVEYALEHNCRTDIINEKSYNRRKQIFIIAIIMSIILILSYLILRELPMYLYLIQCLMIIVTFICGIFMKYKTSQGEEIISKILGFRNFLILAEKNKLEELIMEDPSYFYNILPYTYVSNISDKWIKKFENIKVVNNENINFNYNDLSNYYKIYNEVHQSVHTYRNNNNINQNYYNTHTDSSYCGDSFSSVVHLEEALEEAEEVLGNFLVLKTL